MQHAYPDSDFGNDALPLCMSRDDDHSRATYISAPSQDSSSAKILESSSFLLDCVQPNHCYTGSSALYYPSSTCAPYSETPHGVLYGIERPSLPLSCEDAHHLFSFASTPPAGTYNDAPCLQPKPCVEQYDESSTKVKGYSQPGTNLSVAIQGGIKLKYPSISSKRNPTLKCRHPSVVKA